MVALSACGSLQSASSGQVGCAEEDIVISDDEGGIGTRTWVASCHGRRFFCSAVAGGESAQVSCKEAIAQEPSGEMVRHRESERPRAEPQASGCQFDTQCKGDRICDDGECITPRKKVRAASAPADEEAPSP
jgi:hypothetical protein